MSRRRLLLALAALAAALLLACGGSPSTDELPATSETDQPAASSTSDAITSPSPAPDNPALPTTTATPAQAPEFSAYYATNCAACHGSGRAGIGRTPALTPEALTDNIEDYLDAIDDRTHETIWDRTALDEAGQRALIAFLASTSP